MRFTDQALLETAGLFAGMLFCLELGRRLGRRFAAGEADGAVPGTDAVEAAIFAIFGLLVAFTFSGAATRFEERKQLVVEEANYIGTAWLRLDLLPEPSRSTLRDLFRQYLNSRLETYRRLPDIPAAEKELAHTVELQREIWRNAVEGVRLRNDTATTMLVLSALNPMFDITTTRTAVMYMHPPRIIFAMLFLLALACAFLAGLGMSRAKSRLWIHIIGFAAVASLTVYVILEIEYPRLGLVRVDAADKVLVDLRETMK